ncbi:MAG TPA: protein-disulfide reductase DsbD family protein [Candidatus Defluviicoccus seviourii]|nr:protein-disulfide reductase DsbD family protein [Candidatus Defluviicoccus seviourii]
MAQFTTTAAGIVHVRGGAARVRAAVARGLCALILAAAGLVIGSAPAPAAATDAASAWAVTEHGRVRLISADFTTGGSTQVSLGLEFHLHKGWKIYWRTPGDAGYPPQIDWNGSQNLADAAIRWPAPQRFTVLGFETVGYDTPIVLPIVATLERPGEPVMLQARVDFLTCEQLCVPYTVDLALALPAGAAGESAHAAAIADALARVPVSGEAGAARIDRAAIDWVDGKAVLQLEASARAPFSAPDAFIEGPAELAFAAPQVTLAGGGQRAILRLAVAGLPSEGAEAAARLVGAPLTVTLVDGDRAVEQAITVSTGQPPQTADREGSSGERRSLAAMLAVAILGGLILNLMPCVLPVLSIKLLSVMGHGGGSRRQVRLGFLASAAGILAAFLALAAGVLVLQAMGATVGWGLQFQSPLFLAGMALVLTLFACNLWGLFELPLPGVIADAGARAGHVPGLRGQFLGGVLATLLATPCSAPFVGSALGFAFTQGSGAIIAVFAALGLGLALPYLAVAAVPALATRLRRPGRWMLTLRRALGILLAATALWLLRVLADVSGGTIALGLAGMLILVAGLLAVRRHLACRMAAAVRTAAVGLGIAGVIGAGLLMPKAPQPPAPAGLWAAFDPARIAAEVTRGRVVYVNITAAWCITCKVNESLVLDRPAVQARLRAADVVAMRGDWTRPDPAIADFLAGFQRYGIPFDAVFGPGLPAGEALPELLSEQAILALIARAAAPPRATMPRSGPG